MQGNIAFQRAALAAGFLLYLTLASAPVGGAETGQPLRNEFESRFLKFCDLASAELFKPITPFLNRTNADPATHHMPFFEDGHAVRALAVAYDMTGKRAYLDACRRWSDKMIEYQDKMIPAGAYYMNHSRAPGQDRGQWNVADSGSIGMGVLATAIRCHDPAEKARYLGSVKRFARLVMDNYVGPQGGICNGLWPQFDGEWWCSSATFGTMAYTLYEVTGEEQYLKVANGAFDWLLGQDFRELKPITFQQRPSGTIFYCFELYLAGLKHLPPDSAKYETAVRQIELALDWMAQNQKSRGADVPDYTERNVDMSALPYLMYGFARQVPRFRGIVAAADGELDYIGKLLLAQGDPNVSRLMIWEVMTWGMLSHAERLRPGALLSAARADEAMGELSFTLPARAPEVFERVELSVKGVPAATNPFDPDSISLQLQVTPPSAKPLQVPGYFQREFDRNLEGGREILSPRGEGGWRFRWLPLEAGQHKLVATVAVAGKLVARSEASVEAVAGKRRGFVRVEPEGKRYFRLDDGTPLFLNGLCVCWHGGRGTYDYDDWLAACQQAGINYIRIWMWPEAFGLEWDKGDRVRYRLDNAWRLDRVLAEAEQRGIFVMLCLDYHGIFEVKPDFWGGNNFWPRHPYNAANGGPCVTQNDFFTSDAAKRLYEKRLRYLVARWAAFPNLLAWEFFNEIDNEYAYVKHDDVVAWHCDMGRRLRALDPYEHLISSSFTGGSTRPGLFALPEMDFAQYHSYNERHPARMTAEKTARFFEQYQKPFFVSEYGTDWKGWKPDTDPHFRALHQAIWSGVFTGAAGTGMTWWWESIHAAKLYGHWSALSAFLAGTGMARPDLRPARFDKVEGSVTPFGVAARNEALVWLLDRAYDWPDGAMEAKPRAMNGAKVTLLGVADGAWSVEWWDTLAGKRVKSDEATAMDGALPLAAPDFQADIAARLKKH